MGASLRFDQIARNAEPHASSQRYLAVRGAHLRQRFPAKTAACPGRTSLHGPLTPFSRMARLAGKTDPGCKGGAGACGELAIQFAVAGGGPGRAPRSRFSRPKAEPCPPRRGVKPNRGIVTAERTWSRRFAQFATRGRATASLEVDFGANAAIDAGDFARAGFSSQLLLALCARAVGFHTYPLAVQRPRADHVFVHESLPHRPGIA